MADNVKALKRTRDSNSRYFVSPYEIDSDGNCFLMENDGLILPDESDVVYYVPKNFAGRPDLIASACYNNPMYAWVIMMRNSILDPFSIEAGMKIYIPAIDKINNIFFN